MLVFILGGIPWQVYFQRVLSAKTEKSAMYLSFIAAVGCILAGKIRCYNRAIYFEKVFYNLDLIQLKKFSFYCSKDASNHTGGQYISLYRR